MQQDSMIGRGFVLSRPLLLRVPRCGGPQSTFEALADMSDASQGEYWRQLSHDVLDGFAKLQHAANSIVRRAPRLLTRCTPRTPDLQPLWKEALLGVSWRASVVSMHTGGHTQETSQFGAPTELLGAPGN